MIQEGRKTRLNINENVFLHDRGSCENKELTVSYRLVQFIIIGLWGIAKNLSWVDFYAYIFFGFYYSC